MPNDKDSTGRKWVTGGNAPFREDLVAWPQEDGGLRAEAAAPEVVEVLPADDVHTQLARAKNEIRRLVARIDSLVEENERLRRAGK